MCSEMFFWENFLELQESFGEGSQPFSMRKNWEEKRVEMGERRRERGGGEKKIKSADGKNEFCDHIVFFENHVWGIFLCPELL